MKVVHLICSFTTGGAELMLIDIINEQLNLGYKVQLVVINDCVDEKLYAQLDARVDFYCIKRKPGSRNPFPIIRLNTLLLNLKPDVIHSHDSIIAGMLLPVFYKKMCLTVHTLGVSEKYFRKYKRIIAISDSVKKDLLERTAVEAIWINNSINISNIKKKCDYNFHNEGKFKIVVIGRLEHLVKGQDILIKAINEMDNNYKLNLSVDFIGNGSSEVYLKDLVESLGLIKVIHFLGLKDRSYVYNHLCDYNLLIQPSICEGFGLTVAEAMIAKVPVLVSGKGPVEIVQNGKYGEVFEIGNIRQCSQKISNIITNYQELLSSLDEINKYAEDRYSLTTMVRDYGNVYEKILM